MASALVISTIAPWDDQKVHALYQRLDTHLEALARVADDIRCVFLADERRTVSSDDVKQYEERLRRRWSPKVSLTLARTLHVSEGPRTRWESHGRGLFDFYALSLTRAVRNPATAAALAEALAAGPDLVFAHRLTAMAALMRVPRQLRERAPVIFDLDDIEHVSMVRRLMRSPGWPMERLLLLHVPTLLRGERRAIRNSTATLVCSETDRRYLERFLRVRSVRVVPNGVTIPALGVTPPTEPVVLFVGSLGFAPNAAAADTLVREVWPLVRGSVAEARLVIAGGGAQHVASYPCPDPRVRFTGFVDDLGAVYRQARVVCCPISSGAGTRVKIVEAAAYGKAVVTTPLGAEGLEFEDRREILLERRIARLAAECVRLLRDPESAAVIGERARKKARALYDRTAVVRALVELLRTHLVEQ